MFRTMLYSSIELGFLEANQEVNQSHKKYEIERTSSLSQCPAYQTLPCECGVKSGAKAPLPSRFLKAPFFTRARAPPSQRDVLS